MDDTWVGTNYKFLSKPERQELCSVGGTRGGLSLSQGLNAVLVECVGKGLSQKGYDLLCADGQTRIGIKEIAWPEKDRIILKIPYICVQLVLSTQEVVDRMMRINPFLKPGSFDRRREAGGLYSTTIDCTLQEMHTDIFKMEESSSKRFHHEGILQLQAWALGEIQQVATNQSVNKGDLETVIKNPSEFYRNIVSWSVTAEELCRVLALASPPVLVATGRT